MELFTSRSDVSKLNRRSRWSSSRCHIYHQVIFFGLLPFKWKYVSTPIDNLQQEIRYDFLLVFCVMFILKLCAVGKCKLLCVQTVLSLCISTFCPRHFACHSLSLLFLGVLNFWPYSAGVELCARNAKYVLREICWINQTEVTKNAWTFNHNL